MRIGFHIIDKEFLEDLEEYIKLNAEAEKDKFNGVPNRKFKATIGAELLIQGSRVQNHWVAPRSTSAFHPSEVDKMSTRNFWELSGKK